MAFAEALIALFGLGLILGGAALVLRAPAIQAQRARAPHRDSRVGRRGTSASTA
jgi:hypothetical protein